MWSPYILVIHVFYCFYQLYIIINIKSSDTHISSVESVSSTSSENNDLTEKPQDRSVIQANEQNKDGVCVTQGCVKTGKGH